jgi:Hemerythrin HHE cation binding domain
MGGELLQPRDDLFTLIHKALRREMFGVTTEAAALDWADEARVRPFVDRWQALVGLLHLHARHENRHFFTLAEKKAPGATAPLYEQHEVLDRGLDEVNDAVESAVKGVDARFVYRRIALYTGAYLPHLDTEERQVMPLLWGDVQ